MGPQVEVDVKKKKKESEMSGEGTRVSCAEKKGREID